MKTSVKALDGLKMALTVELEAQIFSKALEKILKNIASKAQIDGFRKGKVPTNILRQQFGAKASTDAANEVVNDTLTEAINKEKINPASRPNITKIDAQDKKIFSYTVEFEVYPEIKVANFSKLKIEQTEAKISSADEQQTIQKLAEQALEYKAVKRDSKDGDQLIIDFKGLIENEVFEGGVANDFKIVLGKSSMIEGFESGLIGASAGADIKLNLTFPTSYHAAQLAGKAVVFEVQVKEVAEPNKAKLDDKFAQKFGEKNIDDLKKSIKKQMETDLSTRLKNQNKDAIFEALLAANDFQVPQASIDSEAQVLKQDMQQRMQQQGIPPQNDMPASTFNPEAQRRVKMGLLVNQIANEHKIEATKQQLEDKLLEMAESYGEQKQQILDYYHKDATRMTSIESMVVEEIVQNLILKTAKVSSKQSTFEKITQAQL
ncbi:MAG: trigger factor [Candidatus Thioglobus sp.]|nr:MAG: trigger factor [Candidatus Thioglobus sp.]KAA0450319.1 MAG: trigger factor [Candidatus Thioglobus sp.]